MGDPLDLSFDSVRRVGGSHEGEKCNVMDVAHLVDGLIGVNFRNTSSCCYILVLHIKCCVGSKYKAGHCQSWRTFIGRDTRGSDLVA